MKTSNLKSAARNGSLYILCGALLAGTLWSGGYFPTPKWMLTFLLLAAAGWELVFSITEGGQARSLRSPALWLLAVFAVFAACSIFWSAVPADTEREAALILAFVSVIFVARGNIVRSGGAALTAFSQWFVYAAGFVSVWGIFTYIYRMPPWSGLLDNIYRAGSTFEYSNALACFGLMALPVTAALHRRALSSNQPFYATAVTLQAAAVILSFSRFGMVALLFIGIYLIAAGWRDGAALPVFLSLAGAMAVSVAAMVAQETQHTFIGLLVVTMLLVVFFALQTVAGRAAIVDRDLPTGMDNSRKQEDGTTGKPPAGIDSSAVRGAIEAVAVATMLAVFFLIVRMERLRVIVTTRFEEGLTLKRLFPHRLDTWAGAIDSFRVKPYTGSGLGSFYYVYQQHVLAVYTKYAHNLVLQTAVETGLIGAALILGFLGYVVFLSCRRLVVKSSAVSRAYSVSTLVFIAFNLFDWEWYVPALTAWFLLGVACLEGPGVGEADTVELSKAPL